MCHAVSELLDRTSRLRHGQNFGCAERLRRNIAVSFRKRWMQALLAALVARQQFVRRPLRAARIDRLPASNQML
jgi:hypothetical protein